jgi:hypothetical protein
VVHDRLWYHGFPGVFITNLLRAWDDRWVLSLCYLPAIGAIRPNVSVGKITHSLATRATRVSRLPSVTITRRPRSGFLVNSFRGPQPYRPRTRPKRAQYPATQEACMRTRSACDLRTYTPHSSQSHTHHVVHASHARHTHTHKRADAPHRNHLSTAASCLDM